MKVLIIAVVFVVCFLLYKFPVIQICGDSMYPNLKDREVYIGVRVSKKAKLKVGEIYVFHPPYDDEVQKYVIKRLSFIDFQDESKLLFIGDNLDSSYDSRAYGFVDRKEVVAKLLKKVGFNNGKEEN